MSSLTNQPKPEEGSFRYILVSRSGERLYKPIERWNSTVLDAVECSFGMLDSNWGIGPRRPLRLVAKVAIHFDGMRRRNLLPDSKVFRETSYWLNKDKLSFNPKTGHSHIFHIFYSLMKALGTFKNDPEQL
jgi:hypothetical protein